MRIGKGTEARFNKPYALPPTTIATARLLVRNARLSINAVKLERKPFRSQRLALEAVRSRAGRNVSQTPATTAAVANVPQYTKPECFNNQASI